MEYSTVAAVLLTAPLVAQLSVRADLLLRLWPALWKVLALVDGFVRGPTDPAGSFEFESRMQDAVRELGRLAVELGYNHVEPPEASQMPMRIFWEGEWYRRYHQKTANRQVATLFGTIILWRFLYIPLEKGIPSLVPLEIRLGIVGGGATLALADRVAQFAVDHGQRDMLKLLQQHHGVGWGVAKLRHVLEAVRDGLAVHQHAAQVIQLLGWLAEADASSGNRKPVLAVGRDGIFLPIRKEPEYKEGATATVSVYDRRGRRLGTVYLGQMPEPLQPTMTEHLTALLDDVLQQWEGPLPRLVYVTDAGHHPTEYFQKVLRRMRHPRRPSERLQWKWVVDYYHAVGRITTLAEAIFGRGREAQAWAAKMRKTLKDKQGGIHRVLHSAAALRHHRRLAGKKSDYQAAYNYLRSRIRFMDYARYRHHHLPIGSGVTEAACKTVFTQRLKRAGMTWGIVGGQIILDLRVLELSGVWEQCRSRWLASQARFDDHLFVPACSASPVAPKAHLRVAA